MGENEPQKQKSNAGIYVLAFMILMAAAIGGVYWYTHRHSCKSNIALTYEIYDYNATSFFSYATVNGKFKNTSNRKISTAVLTIKFYEDRNNERITIGETSLTLSNIEPNEIKEFKTDCDLTKSATKFVYEIKATVK